jgi:hypothetical protein
VNLTGAATATVTADASGVYSFSGIANGSYTITPTKAGFTFTPASQAITVSGANGTANFSSTAQATFTISGTISGTGGPGATVNLTGAATATVTANASGVYTFSGIANGSYTVTPTKAGFTFTPASQAITVSGANATANFSSAAQATSSSIWNSSNTPATVDSGDGTAVELGVKFRADAGGSITGIRFYKAATNTGTHVGHLWSSTGTLLGIATFTSESASGWQQVSFTTPIQIVANTTYIVSYFAPAGHYSDNSNFFAQSGVDNPPLHALANGVDGPNGVYLYGPSGGFPNATFQSTNYWVDVVFVSN